MRERGLARRGYHILMTHFWAQDYLSFARIGFVLILSTLQILEQSNWYSSLCWWLFSPTLLCVLFPPFLSIGQWPVLRHIVSESDERVAKALAGLRQRLPHPLRETRQINKKEEREMQRKSLPVGGSTGKGVEKPFRAPVTTVERPKSSRNRNGNRNENECKMILIELTSGTRSEAIEQIWNSTLENREVEMVD